MKHVFAEHALDTEAINPALQVMAIVVDGEKGSRREDGIVVVLSLPHDDALTFVTNIPLQLSIRETETIILPFFFLILF